MGRTPSPLKANLKEQCTKRNIGNTGSINQLICRLEKYEQKGTKKHKLSCASKTGHTPAKCTHSKQDTPLNISAQCFVDNFYQDNPDQAEINPEWVMGSNQKVKLMVPKWRNTKGGVRMRWVLFREE